MNNISILFLCFILTSCVSSNSYFVRFWNDKNLPDKTNEEREVISLKVMDCMHTMKK